MKHRSIMEMRDYHLLPKTVRRMLVFSETFFFREHGRPKTPAKKLPREAHQASSSVAFCE
jgi:hypothetical protein